MTPAETIASLRADGMVISLVGNRIIISPRKRLTDQFRQRIERQREDLIEHLDLEKRVLAMAQQWRYSEIETGAALRAAAIDPAGWRRFVEHQALHFGTGPEPDMRGALANRFVPTSAKAATTEGDR